MTLNGHFSRPAETDPYVILFQIKSCIWPGRTETTQQTRRSKWPGLSPIVEPGDLETAFRKGE